MPDFDVFDFMSDKYSFETYQSEKYSKVDNDFSRKRRQMLVYLVRKIIKNELSETDRVIFELYWYHDLTQREIALLLGLSRSYVNRRLIKAKDIIRSNLKYVMTLLYGLDF